jgi:hypothetical protein
MSGEDALRDRPHYAALPPASLRQGKMACKVLLDAGGTGDTALGELGNFEEGWSGKD